VSGLGQRCRETSNVYISLPTATPGERADSHHRARTDSVDHTGSSTLRLAGRLHHIGVGRAHVLMLVHHRDVRIINAATGELIRQLTIDTTRDY
jgi:hypothetical protein